MAMESQQAKWFLICRLEQSKCCLNQQRKCRWTYLNVDAIFEILEQFTINIRFIYYLKKQKQKQKQKQKAKQKKKDDDNFKIGHKTC